MKIFPAADLIGGQTVRLTQGDYGKVTHYALSPEDAARAFAKQGAKYMHVVDLDGAKDPRKSNFETIERVIKATGMFVEVGGGIRDCDRIEKYLCAGAGRVILGTAALNAPDFLDECVKKYGEKVCVGVDARDGFVAVKGWTETTGTDAFEFCVSLRDRGVSAVIYTDISRDGMMSGTNEMLYEKLCTIKGLKITASGGICSCDELRFLKSVGVDAAIIGKAMYEGVIGLAEAITAAEGDE